MPYDTQLVAPDLLTLTQRTAAALGPEWAVTGLLGTAIVTHPLGLRCSLQSRDGLLSVSAFVSQDSEPHQPAKPFTATTAMENANGGKVAELIHSRVLPHFGRSDALAALRLLSLPLRDARLPAVAEGTAARSELVLEGGDSANPALRIYVRSPRPGAVSVNVRMNWLTAEQAIRCGRTALTRPASHLEGEADPFPPEVRAVLDALPEINGAPPRDGFTNLYPAHGPLEILHDANAAEPSTPFALRTSDTSIAAAYAVLRTYTTA
ncbi:hypothetical protein [Streptomyces sp. S.PB5]|uniref:hypothetical protein n=1 Tax=Streptomyces sp. S.PB5 TaxID=3020844 RepID=UPI0025AF4344|nr:hypothetical protein [Streptomyces sp. S.PB5]MDN3025711.1 hypothetical protein [Streptomyces sp. S.PB5]